MRFICMGYFNQEQWDKIPPQEQGTLMEACFAYDDELRRGGHFVGGEPLQQRAVTLRPRDGRLEIEHGPYSPSKDQIGGVLLLEARDLEHAIELMSRHPGSRINGFEIRPSNEQLHAIILARQQGQGDAQHPLEAKPGAAHQWLRQLVGRWRMQTQCVVGPDQPPQGAAGRETVRMLGDLWMIAEGEFDSSGEPDRTIMTLGFDPQRGRFIGSFVASMMTHQWQYDGALDDAGRVLTLDTVGPRFGVGGTARYQDIIQIVDANHRILRSQMLGEDGQWRQVMEGHYQRID